MLRPCEELFVFYYRYIGENMIFHLDPSACKFLESNPHIMPFFPLMKSNI